MNRDDVIIKKAIVHILDAAIGVPALSDRELECGPDLYDFFRAHIEKVTQNDDLKNCSFYDDSEIKEELEAFTEEQFIEFSQKLALLLYSIMNANIDIPSADLAVLLFRYEEQDYLGLLKMNYKSSYTHYTYSDDGANTNSMILAKALLPSLGQRLNEAVVIDLSTLNLQLLERKYEINGAKAYYLSENFLKCHTRLSQKTRLNIVARAVEQVDHKYFEDDNIERKMEVKKVLCEAFEEQGSLDVGEVTQKLYADNEDMRNDFVEKIDKYNIAEEVIRPVNRQTVKKFERQYIKTDTGIEISIPSEQYNNSESIEFLTNPDGSLSVLIKNIGQLTGK